MRFVSVLGFAVLFGALLSAQSKQVRPIPPLVTEPVPNVRSKTITGRITDNLCARADHKAMGMGDTDAECTRECVRAHGALLVLFDGKTVYDINDQDVADKFAGQKVTIVASLSGKGTTIERIRSIKAVK